MYQIKVFLILSTPKKINPVAQHNKIPEWEMADGRKIQYKHPPLRQIKINHFEAIVEASPYKTLKDTVDQNVKNIIQ